MTECYDLMASIHKDPRGKSPFWYVAFTTAEGRRAFRSTKQRDRKKAWDVARALEKTNEKARNSELSETALRKMFNDLLEGLGTGPMRPSETVRSFFMAWLSGKEISLKSGVYRIYRKSVTKFLENLGSKADQPLADIVSSDIAAFRDARLKADGVSVGTLTLDMKTVRSVFSLATRQGLLIYNPALAVEMPANRPLERDVFSPEEIRALLSVASAEWRTLILLGYLTGMRLSDAVALRWDCVDLASGWIHHTQGKTDREVTIPIHPSLQTQLLTIAGNDDTRGRLCPILSKIPVEGRGGLSSEFSRLMTRAGIDRQQVQAAKNRFSRKSFHSFRHTFSSALANVGIGADVRMRLTGHKSVDVHQKYTHIELAPLKAAIAALPLL